MKDLHYRVCEHKEDGKRPHGHFWEGNTPDPVMICSTTMGWYYLRKVKKARGYNTDQLNKEMAEAGTPDVATGDPRADRAYIDAQIELLAQDEKECGQRAILENNARILESAGYNLSLQLAS